MYRLLVWYVTVPEFSETRKHLACCLSWLQHPYIKGQIVTFLLLSYVPQRRARGTKVVGTISLGKWCACAQLPVYWIWYSKAYIMVDFLSKTLNERNSLCSECSLGRLVPEDTGFGWDREWCLTSSFSVACCKPSPVLASRGTNSVHRILW